MLSFLAAVVIPLLIHLFNRQKKKRIPFGSIRFLKMLEKKRLKRLRLFEYLLLILRSLIVFLIVLAFTRPTVTSRSWTSAGGTRTSAVVILDDGINMKRYDSNGNRFNRAKEILDHVYKQFAPDDDVLVLTTSGQPETVSDPGALRSKFYNGLWQRTFARAAMWFADNPSFNRELYLLSDFQFRNPDFDRLLSAFDDVRIFAIRIGDGQTGNISIDSLMVVSRLFEANKPVQIEAMLRSSFTDADQNVDLNLYVEGKRVAHQNINLTPLETKAVPLTFQPKKKGLISGFAETGDDPLLADNRYYFAIRLPEQIRVLYVEDEPSAFMEAALSTLGSRANMEIVRETFSSWPRQNFLQYDLIFLADSPVLPESLINRLGAFLAADGALVIMPGTRITPSEFNRIFKPVLGSLRIHHLLESAGSNEYYMLNMSSMDHPIFRGLFRSPNPQPEPPKFYRYFKTNRPRSSEAILSFQNNDPFLSEMTLKKGAVYFLSAKMENPWTNLPVKGLFLPLLSRLMYLGATKSQQIQPAVYAGRDYTISLPVDAGQREYYIEEPGGESNRLTPKPGSNSLSFEQIPMSVPGNYDIRSEHQVLRIISVNAESRNLTAPFIDWERVTQTVPTLRLFAEGSDFQSEIVNARFGFELWKTALILAVLLIIIEVLISKRMEGKGQAVS